MAPIAPARSARRQFASTILTLEAFVVLFATLVAFGLKVAPTGTVWGFGAAMTIALLLAAGMLRSPGGYVAGSVLQVGVLAGGVLVPMMFIVGAIFVAMWVVALRLGGRIDRERVERERVARSDEEQGLGR